MMFQPGPSRAREASFPGKTASKEEIMSNGNDKTAIITGASRGLGRNTAINLARRGVDILFTYHSNLAEAQNLIREIEAAGRKAGALQLDAGRVGSFDDFAGEVRNLLRLWGRD